MIVNIKPIHFEAVRQIDKLSFRRELVRSDENLTNLAAIDPEGSFICFEGENPVGYIFCRTFGRVGYLGPLGVLPEYQGRGYGKMLIREAVKYLSKSCATIGLETLPEWGKNIGLYHSLGFRSTIPARVMQKTPLSNNSKAALNHILQLGSEFSSAEFIRLTEYIREWSGAIYPGLDLSRELIDFQSRYPERIMLAMDQGKITGFLAFHSEYNRYVLGAVRPGQDDQKILTELLNVVESLEWAEQLTVRFQTRFDRLTDIFLENSYRVCCDTTLMLLKGYEGEFEKPDQPIMIRGWVG